MNGTGEVLTGAILILDVFSDEDDMDDMLLTPMDQLDKALQHLADLVFKSQSKSEACSG